MTRTGVLRWTSMPPAWRGVTTRRSAPRASPPMSFEGMRCKHCQRFWKANRGRFVQLEGRKRGEDAAQLILDEPLEHLYGPWIRSRMEYYKRLEAPPRARPPPGFWRRLGDHSPQSGAPGSPRDPQACQDPGSHTTVSFSNPFHALRALFTSFHALFVVLSCPFHMSPT